jgi:hypothetical protein
MGKKIGFYILARNKKAHIRRAVDSVLAQTYSPLTIYLSDQGSTDGTKEILDEYKATYKGPHEIVRLNAPADVPVSMVGLNRHFNYMIDNSDADLIQIMSADDYSDPERTSKTVAIWEKYNCSYIGTRIRVERPDGSGELRTPAFTSNGFVTGAQCLEQKIGGSVAHAFDREFWNKIRPVSELMLVDVSLPFFATQDRGFYVIPEMLAAYVEHVSVENTGLGGQFLAVAHDQAKKRQMHELMVCEVTTSLVGTLQLFAEGKMKYKDPRDEAALMRMIVQRAVDWAIARRNLHAVSLRPIGREA